MRDDSLGNFLKSDIYTNYLNTINDPKARLSIIDKKKSKKDTVSPPSSSASMINQSYGIHNVNAKAKKFFGNTFAILRKSLEKQETHTGEAALMSTFMPDEFSDFSHGTKPIVLTENELDNMKALIHKTVTRIIAYKPDGVTNDNSSIIAQDHPARLTDDESDQFHYFLKTTDARNEFAIVLSQQRTNVSSFFYARYGLTAQACLCDESFETLWRLLKIALIQADIANEYTTAKLLMHMSATYYRYYPVTLLLK